MTYMDAYFTWRNADDAVGLGYGNYRDAHAGALGMFYRPTDKVMLSVGGTMGNGENMINAGITFALDKGKGFGTSKAAMARKINDLTAENAAQGQQIAVQNEKIAAQDVEIQILKEALARLEAKVNNK
ncbi:MAG: YadA C-terminal domain-containing protein [Acidaminococcaceae bacterium]|nr:YadA C-terminal domain-containing protein [Acidaminococcaceae bacterium]